MRPFELIKFHRMYFYIYTLESLNIKTQIKGRYVRSILNTIWKWVIFLNEYLHPKVLNDRAITMDVCSPVQWMYLICKKSTKQNKLIFALVFLQWNDCCKRKLFCIKILIFNNFLYLNCQITLCERIWIFKNPCLVHNCDF